MLPVLIAAAALAQGSPTVLVDSSAIFQGQPGTFTANGVGAPSVVWDPAVQRYVMAFETRTGAADAACPEGYWSIGLAVSDDGYDWELWPNPVVSPTQGRPWSCYAVHPSLLRDTDGTYHLWFKAGQRTDACANNTPTWGCALQPGIGKVSGIVDLDDKSAEIAAATAQRDALQQEIDLVVADVDAAASTFMPLLTNSTALECVDYADVCSPCHSFELEVTHVPGGPVVRTQQDLCQAFDFTVPGQINVSSGAAGQQGSNRAYLRFSGLHSNALCTYKGTSDKPLDAYLQRVGQGNCDVPSNAHWVELEVVGSSNSFPSTTAYVVLNATNQQTWQGPGYQTLASLAAAASAGDEMAMVHAEAALVVLDDLRDELAGLSGPDVSSLDAAAAQLEAALVQALAEYDALDAQRQVVLAELAVLQAYQPSVQLSGIADLSLRETRASFPTVVKVGNTWHMQVQVKRNIRAATSTNGQNFTISSLGTIANNLAFWSTTELLSPSLLCDAPGSRRFQSVVIGRETLTNIPGDPVAVGAVGDATSSDFLSWLFNVTPWANSGFVGNEQWRHVDVLRQGSAYRIWLTDINGAGRPVIRMGSAGPTSNTGGEGRVCQ